MQESDAALVGRAVAGDTAAFAELLRRHDQAVHAYLARRSGRQDADDLLSKVWLRAFEARASYGGETITLRFGFLAPTTVNLATVTAIVPPGFAKEAGAP
jgi:DNA-directed RNA polymerase specialized sigma24 family protein